MDLSNVMIGSNTSLTELIKQAVGERKLDASIAVGSICADPTVKQRNRHEQQLQELGDLGVPAIFLTRGTKEVGVDETLRATIVDWVITHSDQSGTCRLVLMTGDGNESETGSFATIVKFAAKSKWHVQIWSWSRKLSSNFLDIAKEWPHQLSIQYLDNILNKCCSL